MKYLFLIALLLANSTIFSHGNEKHDKDLADDKNVKAEEKEMDGRTIDVTFTAKSAHGLPVDFYPLTKKMKVKLGERSKVIYRFKNKTNKDLPILAVHSIDPYAASDFFRKYVCFCFEDQLIKAKQQIDMPVEFRITTKLPKHITKMSIDYTLYEKKPPREDLRPIAKNP